jgi:Holliday junction resolvasome RuvABC DNA-binding subunit
VEALFRADWRSAGAVAKANPDEIASLPGVGSDAAAARLIDAAGKAAAIEAQQRAEERARESEQAHLASEEEADA